jgi:DASS family divalent anion:Na+ symporter
MIPTQVEGPAALEPSATPVSRASVYRKLGILVLFYALIAHVLPVPAGVTPAGWRVTAIFLSTILGFMLQPLPAAAMVILSLVLIVFVGGIPMTRALSGYSSPSVWMVGIAILISRAANDTGLARRIALFFVKHFGQSSLGVAYSLTFSEITLAAGIPSITARSAGIVLPIARNIAELYDSRPGPTAARLGTFLMTSLYQSSAVACAMFITGQASNVLAAKLASAAGVTVTGWSWFVAGLAPGLVSAFVVPWAIFRLLKPRITRTPSAAAFASDELTRMGPIRGKEAIVLLVFSAVALLWLTSGWHGLDVAAVALGGIGVLLLTGAFHWETALKETGAWDMFVWYGGLFTLGEILNETGSTKAFAQWVGGGLGHMQWMAALLVTLLVFFYAHYFFASITAHILAMFPPFLAMLVGLGTPPMVAVYSLACLANLTAGLTHYGTTTGPIVYGVHYVSFRDWWRVGLIVSLINLTIWLTVGLGWWRLLHFW